MEWKDGCWQMAGKIVDGWWLMVDGRNILRRLLGIPCSLLNIQMAVDGWQMAGRKYLRIFIQLSTFNLQHFLFAQGMA